MKRFKILLGCATVLSALAMILSCSNPSPLYGQWISNAGSKLVANTDMSFVLTLSFPGETVVYEGSYSLYNNAVTFSDSGGTVIVSEWDIRASILYLLVPNPITDETELVELYQTGK